MTHIKLLTTACLLIALLCACSPSQDKAKQQTDQPQAELDPKTQKFMQTDLSETLPEDKMPASSETGMNHENLDTASIADEQTEAEAMPEEEFDIRVYRAESQGSMTGYIDKIDIISLNDQPTTITGVQVNRGNCGITSMYDYKNMRYGSVALAYPRCKVESIREVSISTDYGTYAYRIS
ncbi:hypothetical protein [Acinetobacter radioresistens]|uniref:hypothetical protein n=1 Tax=Acinetobacter radioresistens TaxID=40216 RepID=UPI002004BBB8|nr:hypothetical protein [Acinetobacter radioresistens]